MPNQFKEVLNRLIAHLRERFGPDAVLNEDVDIVDGLGLDSNGVLELLMEIEDEFDISIPMNQLVDVRTIGQLARKIDELLRATT